MTERSGRRWHLRWCLSETGAGICGREGLGLDAEVLKVGHHGSDTSSADAFLDAVGPEVAVISVGTDNRYDHPAPETLDRIAARGIATYRTDETGTIVVRSNGITHTVNAPVPTAQALRFMPMVLREAAMGPDPMPTLTPASTPTAAAPTATHTGTATQTPTVTRTATRTPTATFTLTPVPPTATHTPVAPPLPTSSVMPSGGLGITALQYEGSDEYVGITNQGTAAQDMSGWRLWSVVGDQTYHFTPGHVLGAGVTVRVHSGPGAIDNPPSGLRWTGRYIWNNDGDEARLYNASGSEVDRRSY